MPHQIIVEYITHMHLCITRDEKGVTFLPQRAKVYCVDMRECGNIHMTRGTFYFVFLILLQRVHDLFTRIQVTLVLESALQLPGQKQ